MEELQAMMAQRDMLEIEADAIHSELTSVGVSGAPPAGLSGSLVDAEGFPRGDVDIYNVKTKRKRWNEINTDHKILMKKIEVRLGQVYAEKNQNNTSTSTSTLKAPSTTIKPAKDATLADIMNTLEPIARLDEILSGSPAFTAGIKNGDYLLQFGKVNMTNANGMAFRLIASTVSESVNSSIAITVRRNGTIEELSLTPKTWEGRGLLGCHLSPITK